MDLAAQTGVSSELNFTENAAVSVPFRCNAHFAGARTSWILSTFR